jgi:hypothetical protein
MENPTPGRGRISYRKKYFIFPLSLLALPLQILRLRGEGVKITNPVYTNY